VAGWAGLRGQCLAAVPVPAVAPVPQWRSRPPGAGASSPAPAPWYWRDSAGKSSDFPRVAYPSAKLAMSVFSGSTGPCCVARVSSCRHHLSSWRLTFGRSLWVLCGYSKYLVSPCALCSASNLIEHQTLYMSESGTMRIWYFNRT
jgi:hypothetical protein